MRPVPALGVISLLLLPACASHTARPTTTQQQINTQINVHGAVYSLELTRNLDAWETTVPAPVERVWAAVPDTYEQLGLTGGGLLNERELAFGYRARMPRRVGGKRPSAYLSCGRGMTGDHADDYEVRLFVVTSVEPVGDGARVSTTVDASAHPRGVSGAPVTCSSKGELERLIAHTLFTSTAGHGPSAGQAP